MRITKVMRDMKQSDRKERSKEKILSAAVNLFAQEGYGNCSTTKIAKNAGVSYGLLYYHFKNKDEILEFILTSGLEKLKRDYEKPRLSGDAVKDLNDFLDRYINAFKDDRGFWFVYSGITFDPKVSIDSLKTLENEYAKLQNKYLIGLFKQLGVKNPTAEAFFLDSSLYGLMMHTCMMKDETVLNYGIDMLKRKYSDG